MIYSVHVQTDSIAAGRQVAAHPVRAIKKAEAIAAALEALKVSRPHSRAKGTRIIVRLYQGKAARLIWEADRSWLSYSVSSLEAAHGLGPSAGVLVLRDILRKSREADKLTPPARVAFDQILRLEIERGARKAKRAAKAQGDDR
jgi:hypothetical protein